MALEERRATKNPASRRALENFRRNSLAFQNIGDVFGGHDLVTRRIGGIDANQVLQPNERFALEFYDVRAGTSGQPAPIVTPRPAPHYSWPNKTCRRMPGQEFERSNAPFFSFS